MTLRFFLLLLLSSIVTGAFASSPLHVVIDPGHGGHDGGATRGKIRESQIVMNISKDLQKLLSADPRFKVSMTRTSNKFIPLEKRADQANKLSADLFVSIHANSSPDKRARGLEVYFQNQLSVSEESMLMANLEHEGLTDQRSRNLNRNELQNIPGTDHLSGELKHIVSDLVKNHRINSSGELSKLIYKSWSGTKRLKRHSIRQAPFFVVSNVNMPSVLVEVGFVSNTRESKRIKRRSYQKHLAQGLYKSLIQYQKSFQ